MSATETMQIELTPALVRAYLTSLSPGAICGESWNAHDCPLARALRFAGCEHARVTRYTYRTVPFGFRFSPPWAEAFVATVDESKAFGVRADTALRILDAVTAVQE